MHGQLVQDAHTHSRPLLQPPGVLAGAPPLPRASGALGRGHWDASLPPPRPRSHRIVGNAPIELWRAPQCAF